MNKKLKKMIATVSAVIMCAVSMTAITSNARSYNITPYTVSFTVNGQKYVVWQEMNDYFDDKSLNFFISEDGTKDILFYNGDAIGWGFFGYEFENKEEDAISLKKYLSDNNIQYEESTSFKYTRITIPKYIYKNDEYIQLFKKDEYIQLLKKIKEDTGFIQMIVSPDLIMLENVTDIENTIPEPTLLGDANEDGKVTIADAVFIMQALSNPDEFQLTPQGMANADIVGDGDGVTVMDALKIQEMEINM